MPHFKVEYTDNIKTEGHIPDLLRKANKVLELEGYPVAGMRAFAIELKEYELVDGKNDYAMVHAALKLAPGHTVPEKKRACEVLFEMMKEHFKEVFETRYLLLSLEFVEVVSGDGPTLKLSNVHTLFKPASLPTPS